MVDELRNIERVSGQLVATLYYSANIRYEWFLPTCLRIIFITLTGVSAYILFLDQYYDFLSLQWKISFIFSVSLAAFCQLVSYLFGFIITWNEKNATHVLKDTHIEWIPIAHWDSSLTPSIFLSEIRKRNIPFPPNGFPIFQGDEKKYTNLSLEVDEDSPHYKFLLPRFSRRWAWWICILFVILSMTDDPARVFIFAFHKMKFAEKIRIKVHFFHSPFKNDSSEFIV